jgi:hypothetical protein
MPCNPKVAPLIPPDDERRVLETWTRRRTTAQALTLPAWIVLTCAKAGALNTVVAQQLSLDRGLVASAC